MWFRLHANKMQSPEIIEGWNIQNGEAGFVLDFDYLFGDLEGISPSMMSI